MRQAPDWRANPRSTLFSIPTHIYSQSFTELHESYAAQRFVPNACGILLINGLSMCSHRRSVSNGLAERGWVDGGAGGTVSGVADWVVVARILLHRLQPCQSARFIHTDVSGCWMLWMPLSPRPGNRKHPMTDWIGGGVGGGRAVDEESDL